MLVLMWLKTLLLWKGLRFDYIWTTRGDWQPPFHRFAVSVSILTCDCLDPAVFVVGELADLQTAKPGLAAGGNAVVVEQIPFAAVFDDAVVSGPAYDRSKDLTLIYEGTVGIVADRIAEEMAVACRV